MPAGTDDVHDNHDCGDMQNNFNPSSLVPDKAEQRNINHDFQQSSQAKIDQSVCQKLFHFHIDTSQVKCKTIQKGDKQHPDTGSAKVRLPCNPRQEIHEKIEQNHCQ